MVEEEVTPQDFVLEQNYPNPFNPMTRIKFSIQNPDIISIKVFDMVGREVATILGEQYFEKGQHEVDFNGGTLASGVYFYRIMGKGTQLQAVRKMVLIK